ncbi:MAG TPA: hypothetical protein VL918_01855 [Sphingobium sp.]|nr:hypothetical protein [Sphingobium sp.]
MFSSKETAAYYRRREAQELKASQMAVQPEIRSLHWKMARRYAELAERADDDVVSPAVGWS